jgi:hypothetical protein
MATLIHEKNPGSLVASSERTVETYESGLLRVDQVYTCATASAGGHRAALTIGSEMPDGNARPSFDGISIFPTPQEVTRQDGFTNFMVSGYGRTQVAVKNFAATVKTVAVAPFFFSLYEISGSVTIKRGNRLVYDDLGLEPFYALPFAFLPIIPADEITSAQRFTEGDAVYNVAGWDGFVVPRIISQYRVTTKLSQVDIVDTKFINISNPEIAVQNSRNFGNFTEIDFTTVYTISTNADLAPA